MWVTESTTKALTPTAVAIGNFDGLHRGHRQVIQPAIDFGREQGKRAEAAEGAEEAEEAIINSRLPNASLTRRATTEDTSATQSLLNEGKMSAQLAPPDSRPPVCTGGGTPARNWLLPTPHSTVVTFNPHPQEYFSGQSRQLLTPLPEKIQQLSTWGIEQLVLLPFNRELAALSPEDFVEQILVRQLQAQTISVGQDFRFGKQRRGTATDLQAIAARFDIPVAIVPNYNHECERISSSAIRQALTEGNVRRAQMLLDRPYTLIGTVVKGQQLGRTIGFPTANVQLPENKFLPRLGVYAVRVLIEGERIIEQGEQFNSQLPMYNSQLIPNSEFSIAGGVMNLGYRPTVNGIGLTVEVHLFDWSGDLYGKAIAVQLEEFIRPEQKFASLDELKAQIAADAAKAKSLLRLESTTTFEKVD